MLIKTTYTLLVIMLLLSASVLTAAVKRDTTTNETQLVLKTITGELSGSLRLPPNFKQGPVALFIAGSGLTDRDGNNPAMKNNSLKLLAGELAKNGIATLRYDKRGVGQSKAAAKSEADLRFEDLVRDARDWIQLLKNDKRFSKVIVIGHSEGSLIGMLAATAADKFISVAGPGQSADNVLKEQLSAQPKQIRDMCFPIIDSLSHGKRVENVNPALFSLFRPSVQPYMMSWFRYDPQVEIKKLNIPVLIIQGTSDIQVSVEDAKRLSAANQKAGLVLVDKMNHIFKMVEGDKQANALTYSNPSLPVAEEMVKNITAFILKK